MYGFLARADTHTVKPTHKQHRHPYARMANEFIRTTFDDRHQLVNSAVNNNSKREIATGKDDLIETINDGNEQRWQNLLRKIVNWVALKRKCDGHVGKYLNDHYQHWTQKKRNQLTANCTYSKKIFMKWDVIVTNLTKHNMSHVNPQLFSIRKLYDATSPAWCEREREQTKRCFGPPEHHNGRRSSL